MAKVRKQKLKSEGSVFCFSVFSQYLLLYQSNTDEEKTRNGKLISKTYTINK